MQLVLPINQDAKMSEEIGMIKEHRDILRKNRENILINMHTDQVLMKMTHVFTEIDEEDIKEGSSDRRKAEIMVDKLPRMGELAFQSFVDALLAVHPFLAKHLAEEAGISLSPPSQNKSSHVGMEAEHRKILYENAEQFEGKIDIERMVKCLVKQGVLTESISHQILQQTSETDKVRKLMVDILPKSGPDAFEKFCCCLMSIQPTFANDWKNDIKKNYPDVAMLLGGSFQESDKQGSSDMQARTPSSCTMTLSSPLSELPEEVKQILKDVLDEPADELFENDWKLFYKTLRLPAGKEDFIQGKGGSPTGHVIDSWIRSKGKLANIKNLFCALEECHHGDLIARIEKIIGVEYKETNTPVDHGHDVAEGIQNMNVEKDKPVTTIGEIPALLKPSFINQLDALEIEVLENIATNILEERCYVNGALDFLEKTKNYKMRILFRCLRKENQHIVTWMRNKLPPGSTGPFKVDDECRANHMPYLHRYEVTKKLTANEDWKTVAAKVGLTGDDIKLLGRSKEPAEAVFSHWEVRSGTTVGALYDLLVNCGLCSVADML